MNEQAQSQSLDRKPFGARVKQARVAAGLSLSELARLLDTTPQAIKNYENRNDGIAIDKLFVLADTLGVSGRWLAIGGDDNGKIGCLVPGSKEGRIAKHLAALPDAKLDALALVLGINL